MVPTPGAYGLILLKNDKTEAFYKRHLEHTLRWMRQFRDPNATAEKAAEWLPRDEHLWSCSIAQGGLDLERLIRELAADGAVHGEDFVVTESGRGVLDPLPDWLLEELLPTGNPPELEAKMTPEVREMWEQTRRRVYHFRAA
jgi:hypothetical protein